MNTYGATVIKQCIRINEVHHIVRWLGEHLQQKLYPVEDVYNSSASQTLKEKWHEQNLMLYVFNKKVLDKCDPSLHVLWNLSIYVAI